MPTGSRCCAGEEAWPDPERKALVFARKMMTAAYTVTDEEFADLLAIHGEKPMVAMVLMLAHASFHDRMILSLGLGADTTSPLAPVAVHFSREEEAREHLVVPVRELPGKQPLVQKRSPDADWLSFDRGMLQKCMAEQKERKSRIRIPTPEEYASASASVPQSQQASQQGAQRTTKVLWNIVTSGYQPQLAAGWSEVTRAFRAEANQDSQFSNSVFWVVTRSLQCFY